MARCPFAQWRPLKRADGKPDCDKTQVIVHSMSGHFAGSRSTFENSSADSTFMLALDGELHQLMESQKAANANGSSNRRAISIETEDGSASDAIINRTPWTPEQVLVLIKLLRWCSETHGIPLVRIPDPASPGIGYHMMFRARFPKGNPWTKHPTKVCPGAARERQFESVILPELARYELKLDGGAPPKVDLLSSEGDMLSLDGGGSAGGGLLDARAQRQSFLYGPADAYRMAPPTVMRRDRHRNLVAPSPLPPVPSTIARAAPRRAAEPKKTRKR